MEFNFYRRLDGCLVVGEKVTRGIELAYEYAPTR